MANSNGDENAHASSLKKVTMLRVIDEKESKSRLKDTNSGSTAIHHDGIGAFLMKCTCYLAALTMLLWKNTKLLFILMKN